MYSSLNIFIAVVDIFIWNDKNELFSVNASEIEILMQMKTIKYSLLSSYRQKRMFQHPNDLLILLTTNHLPNQTFGSTMNEFCTGDVVAWIQLDNNLQLTVYRFAKAIAVSIKATKICQYGWDNTKWIECKNGIRDAILSNEWELFCLRYPPMEIFNFSYCKQKFLKETDKCDCKSNGNCYKSCHFEDSELKCSKQLISKSSNAHDIIANDRGKKYVETVNHSNEVSHKILLIISVIILILLLILLLFVFNTMT